MEYRCHGDYTGERRNLARMVKRNDPTAIAVAARILSGMLPKGSIVVPIPSHNGGQSYNLHTCRILEERYGHTMLDCIRSTEHESLRSVKHRELHEGRPKGSLMPKPEELGMYLAQPVTTKKKICLIDNVIASGTTATAAAMLFTDAMLYCLADDVTYPKIPNIIIRY